MTKRPSPDEPHRGIRDQDLVAFVDGELHGAERERIERAVAADPALAREVELLRRTGELLAGLPRSEPGPGFTARVVHAARAHRDEPGGRVLRPTWLRYAAAAGLVAAAAGAWWLSGRGPAVAPDAGVVLTASETEEIARDLYVLANLEVLETLEAADIESLVNDLDLLESPELEDGG